MEQEEKGLGPSIGIRDVGGVLGGGAGFGGWGGESLGSRGGVGGSQKVTPPLSPIPLP